MADRIYLSSPHMSDEGYEKEYVQEAFDTNWIAPLGANANGFEQEFAAKVGAKHATALTSVIGSLADNEKLAGEFSYAFPAFGDSKLRMKWMEKHEENCFMIPVLAHPSAFISPSDSVYPGSVIEARAMINTNSVIERGCIIELGSIVDHDSFSGFGCQIDCGAIVKAHCVDMSHTEIESGQVVTRDDMPTPEQFLKSTEF